MISFAAIFINLGCELMLNTQMLPPFAGMEQKIIKQKTMNI